MNAPVSPAAPPPASPGPAGSLDEDAALTVDQVSEPPPGVAPSLAAPCRDALLQALPCPLCSRFPPGSRPAPPRLRPTPSPPRVLGRPASKIPRSAPPGALASGVGLPKGELVSLEEAPRPREDALASSCSERGPRLPLTGRFPEVIEDPLETFFEEVEVDIDRPPPPRPRKPPPPPPASRKAPPVPSAPPPRATPAPPPSATLAPPEASDPEPSPSIPVVTSDAPPEASERPARSRPWLTPRGAAASEPTPRPPASSTPAPSSAVAPRPVAVISDFDEPLPLDPRQAAGIPRSPPPPRPRRRLHPKAVALFGGLFGLAAIGTVLTFAIRFGTPPTKPVAPGRAASSSAAAPRASASAAASAEPEPPDPGPWRVASLANEEGVKMISGKLGTRSLMTALEEEHVPKPQIFRILKAFDDPKLFDKPKKSHQFVVAFDRPSKRVRGFEYQASATEVWQAKEVEEGRLTGAKLDLKIEQRRVTRGVVVDGSLKASLVEAGLDDDMVGLLDDALSDRVTIDRLGKGTRLRVVAQEQLVAGRFSRYLSLDAVEYRLPRADKPTRLYHFRSGKMSGVYDAAGKAPYRTSWGPPLKVVRITSKFNPKRLHPVLHTVMPHNGTDFGAAMGTPVYAVAAGTVSHVGPHGPSGNLVLIEHANGLESGYAHLSRFAQGLKKGDKVETQQLVGYVGSTGRSTGPHLHFSIKKAGAYIDAMTVIKLNQERVLPKGEREVFEAFRKEMDQLLDAIPLADAPPAEGTADPDESEHRDDNNHGEEHEGEAAPSSSGNAAPSPSGPEPPPAAPVTDDTTPESAVWRPDLPPRRDMAPRLWLWNLDAELELANPGYTTPSAATRERIARLRPWLQGLLAPGDEVLDEEGGQFGRHVGVAWCPTPRALRRLGKAGALVPEAPPVEVLRAANHRRFCASLGQALPGARFVEDMDALRAAVATPSCSGTWLLKRSLGFAGRGQLRTAVGPLSEDARRWAEAPLRRGEGLQVEPLVERLGDFSLHGLLARDGSLRIGAPTAQHCSPLGAWEGSTLAGSELPDQEREALHEELRSVGAALHRLGYFGPFNVDAFAWCGEGGRRCFLPRCEINARYSMGWAVGMPSERLLLQNGVRNRRPRPVDGRPLSGAHACTPTRTKKRTSAGSPPTRGPRPRPCGICSSAAPRWRRSSPRTRAPPPRCCWASSTSGSPGSC